MRDIVGKILKTLRADADGFEYALGVLDGADAADRVTPLFERFAVGTGLTAAFGTGGGDMLNGSTRGTFLFGGAGADVLTGSWHADMMLSGAGDDTIRAGGGADEIWGGGGFDVIYGGAGDDRIFGNVAMYAENPHADDLSASIVYGGAGHDRIQTDSGDDEIRGGAGNDEIRSRRGDDVVRGGGGDDLILTYHGRDTVYGGTGKDTLNGSYGDDILYGGAGDDYIDGYRDNDTIYGGGGGDVIMSMSWSGEPEVAREFGAAKVTSIPRVDKDLIYGGADSDTFIFRWLIDATQEIQDKHTDASGDIDYMAIAQENGFSHAHWVDSIGVKRVADFNPLEDQILFEGHTIHIDKNVYYDADGDGFADDTRLQFISLPKAFGAHEFDKLGVIIFFDVLIDESMYSIDNTVHYGLQDTDSIMG